MKYLFPEGHKVKNLTRQRDCKQLVLHYIPYIEVVRRLLRNEAFAGKMYHNFEVQWSARRNGVRTIGRSNSGTLLEGAQIRANRLAAGSGLAKPGLETREPERRTCCGMGSTVSRILQCDYIIITQ